MKKKKLTEPINKVKKRTTHALQESTNKPFETGWILEK
jgi:hypothetical protein